MLIRHPVGRPEEAGDAVTPRSPGRPDRPDRPTAQTIHRSWRHGGGTGAPDGATSVGPVRVNTRCAPSGARTPHTLWVRAASFVQHHTARSAAEADGKAWAKGCVHFGFPYPQPRNSPTVVQVPDVTSRPGNSSRHISSAVPENVAGDERPPGLMDGLPPPALASTPAAHDATVIKGSNTSSARFLKRVMAMRRADRANRSAGSEGTCERRRNGRRARSQLRSARQQALCGEHARPRVTAASRPRRVHGLVRDSSRLARTRPDSPGLAPGRPEARRRSTSATPTLGG